MSESWYHRARCRTVNPAVFFPEKHANGHTIQTAKRICEACSVLSECLAYALGSDVEGVWGGTVQKERDRLRRQLGMGRRPGVKGDRLKRERGTFRG